MTGGGMDGSGEPVGPGTHRFGEQAGGAELAVLLDGPRQGLWLWRDALTTGQAGTSLIVGHYQPTEDWVAHPTCPTIRGRAWRYQPPRPTPAEPPGVGCDRADPAEPAPRRVLITGSRTWTDTTTLRDVLAGHWGDGRAVLVSGGCPTGADRLAEQCWTRWGGHIEQHPADWQAHGRAAGYRRNTRMVELGADVCLAFIRDHSPGARHTAHLATRPGTPERVANRKLG